MKKYVIEFVKRGMVAAAGGPVVLAIVYGILGKVNIIESLTPFEVCKGILTVTLLAFVAAGVSIVYTIDRLPLMWAIGIHGGVLYLDYILIYLFNGWLKSQLIPVLVFTGIFVAGYGIIWICIYRGIRTKTASINAKISRGGSL